MIEFIKGRLVSKTPTQLVVEAAGVGYFINISLHTYTRVPDTEQVTIFTHLSIKEDAHTLFGFVDEEERMIFRQLISVSGVGAGTARMILSSMSPAEIQHAIAEGNAPLLQGIKGIGAKSAMRIIIDLKDKMKKEEMYTLVAGKGNTHRAEALSALVTLGFPKLAVEKALDKILKDNTEMAIEDLVKLSLKSL